MGCVIGKCFLLTISLMLSCVSLAANVIPIDNDDCHSKEAVDVTCNMLNPGDMVKLSSNDIIVSQYGSVKDNVSGHLAWYRTDSKKVVPLFPLSGVGEGQVPKKEILKDNKRWGEKNCTQPSAVFNPQGIGLTRRHDGDLVLAVVNHGARESIELFSVTDVSLSDQTNTQVQIEQPLALEWRGCILQPDNWRPFDVVPLRDGGLIYTLTGISSDNSEGVVVEWHQGELPKRLRNTGGANPTGIELSDDEKYLYINYYKAGVVKRYDRQYNHVINMVHVLHPVHSTWFQNDKTNGRMLVASHQAPHGDILACRQLTLGKTCPLAFSIYSIDWEKQKKNVIYANAGTPMGFASVALQVDRTLYIGSSVSNRMLVVRAKSSQDNNSQKGKFLVGKKYKNN